MAKLRKDLKKFKGLLVDRPIVIDSSLIRLFRDLGERSDRAITMSIIVQRIAHMVAGTKTLDLSMQEFFDLFPFIDSRYLRKWGESNNQHEFARRYNLQQSGISLCLCNKLKSHKDWTFQPTLNQKEAINATS